MCFKHFASKNQLPGFYISGTLVENGLISFGGVVPTPTAFLMSIFLKNCLTSGAFICWKLKLLISEPQLILTFNTLEWFWYDLIILSITSLSFKDPSVATILLGIFPQLFLTMLISRLLNACEISYPSVMTFFFQLKLCHC